MTLIESTNIIKKFVGTQQMKVMKEYCKGEEGEFFKTEITRLAELITTMPKTYETDNQGWKAVAHLHYFTSNWDFYITELDKNKDQHQAFGITNGFDLELGYINIPDILKNGAELDLHWKPKTIEEIREEASFNS